MIRQLPKLTVPSFVTNDNSIDNNIKIYDVITEATTLNSEGNTMQL